jgi:HAD superfamily hydrolase (TIGR01509 family)
MNALASLLNLPPSTLTRAYSVRDHIARVPVVIFDVDGTLAETESVHRCAFNAAFGEAGIGWYWGQRTYKKLLQVTGGKERIRAFARSNPPRLILSDDDIASLHQRKTAHYTRLIAQHAGRLRPGVEPFIHSALARGQTLAIATTTTFDNIDALLRVALEPGWRNHFAAVVAGDDVALKKPSPDVYLEVLARLQRPAADCLAIEDSANGLKAATAASIPTLITRSEYFRDDDFSQALFVVDDLSDLL